jgi:hypothetical protein
VHRTLLEQAQNGQLEHPRLLHLVLSSVLGV